MTGFIDIQNGGKYASAKPRKDVAHYIMAYIATLDAGRADIQWHNYVEKPS